VSKNFAEILNNNFFQSSESPLMNVVVDAVRYPSLCDALFSSVEAIERGLTRSEFSRRYLHADRNYLSVCRNRKRGISERRIVFLCQSLRQRSLLWRSIASADHRVQQHCQARAAAYADLAADVLSLLTHISHCKR
jgi:hypothetical protein